MAGLTKDADFFIANKDGQRKVKARDFFPGAPEDGDRPARRF